MTKILAEEWIKDYTRELSIFPHENHNQLLHLSHSTFIGVKYRFFYDQIAIQDMIKLDGLPAMLNDLVEIRIFEPASKLRPLELMEQFFGVCHNRKTYYKIAPGCIDLKKKVVDDNTIIDRYHELYKIEKPSGYQKTTCKQDLSFILRKNPLSCIYLVCFMALVISMHIELKTGISIWKFIDESKKVVDGEILNHITQKIVAIKAQPSEKMKALIAKLDAPH